MYSICGESLLNTYSTQLYLNKLREQIGEFDWFPLHSYDISNNQLVSQFMLIFKDGNQMTRAKEILRNSLDDPFYNVKEQWE